MKTAITEKLRQDIAILQEFWRDRFRGPMPPPSQFATWLRLYEPDVIVAGFDAGKRWLDRIRKGVSTPDLIRYVWACMRNMQQNRELDAGAE